MGWPAHQVRCVPANGLLRTRQIADHVEAMDEIIKYTSTNVYTFLQPRWARPVLAQLVLRYLTP